MLCELCGTEVERTRPVSIEGTVLNVGPECARFGVETSAPVPRVRVRGASPAIAERLERRARRMTPKDVYAEAGDEEVVADFAQRIRQARQTRGWKQADLGAKINERASVIAKLESGAMWPDDALMRKLERALGIRLKEKVAAVAVKKESPKGPITLGDLVNLEEQPTSGSDAARRRHR